MDSVKKTEGTKRERAEIRLVPDAKRRLDVASATSGKTPGEIVERLIFDRLPAVPDSLVNEVARAV